MKALLLIVALGVWLNLGMQFLILMAAQDIGSDLAFIHQWVLNGAPVSN